MKVVLRLILLLSVGTTAGAYGLTTVASGRVIARHVSGIHLTSQRALANGDVVRHWSDGVTVVGYPGARVVIHQTGHSVQVLMRPAIDPRSNGADRRWAMVYASSGRSVAAEASAAGIPASAVARLRRVPSLRGRASIIDSGCAEVNNSVVYWRGCYTRYATTDSDPNNHYGATESEASGYAKNSGDFLAIGRTDHHWDGSNAQIVKWSPNGDRSVGKCTIRTISLSAYGVSMSDSYPICPDADDMSQSAHLMTDEFTGVACGQNNRAAAAETIASAPNGDSLGWSYGVYANWVTDWPGC